MDDSQDELGIDNENNRTIFLREIDPFLLVIPSPEIEEEPLEGGLNWTTLGQNLVLYPMTQKNARTHQFLGKRQPALLP